MFYAIHNTLYVLAGMFLSWHFLNTDLSSRLRCTRTDFTQCLLLLSHLLSPSSFCFQTVQFGGLSNSDHNAQIHLLFQPRSHTCKTKISLLKTSLYCKIEYTLILYSTALHLKKNADNPLHWLYSPLMGHIKAEGNSQWYKHFWILWKQSGFWS